MSKNQGRKARTCSRCKDVLDLMSVVYELQQKKKVNRFQLKWQEDGWLFKSLCELLDNHAVGIFLGFSSIKEMQTQ